MSEYTKEPWSCETPCPGKCCWGIFGADGERINYPEMSGHDARRICAAVNACAGIPTETLERVSLESNTLKQQRDDLLAACKQALYALKGREHDGFLRDAIARAEGREVTR